MGDHQGRFYTFHTSEKSWPRQGHAREDFISSPLALKRSVSWHGNEPPWQRARTVLPPVTPEPVAQGAGLAASTWGGPQRPPSPGCSVTPAVTLLPSSPGGGPGRSLALVAVKQVPGLILPFVQPLDQQPGHSVGLAASTRFVGVCVSSL